MNIITWISLLRSLPVVEDAGGHKYWMPYSGLMRVRSSFASCAVVFRPSQGGRVHSYKLGRIMSVTDYFISRYHGRWIF